MNCYLIYTVTHIDILYTGMTYHEKKEVGYWRTVYSIVKDLDVLKQVIMQSSQYACNYYYLQYIKDEHANAEHDDIDTFKFVQPNGSLMLSIQTIQQSGWIVDPHKSPMKVHDSRD